MRSVSCRNVFMHFARTSLIISLALSMGLANAAHASVRTPCIAGFQGIAARPPDLKALKMDLPEIKDPVQYIAKFEERRSQWNQLNLANRNNFPMPEMDPGVTALLKSLKKVKRPAENRLAAERYIKELTSLRERGFPYRDSLLKMHEALNVVALKHPLTPEKAQEMVRSGAPRRAREKFDAEKFFTQDNKDRRVEFEQMMEKEIFYPTAHNQTVDGLAESFLLGIRPLQITERASITDQLDMTSLHRFEHDVAHIVIQQSDRLSKVIAALPLESRIGIARDIGNLATPREQHLARFGVFQTLHEWGNDSMIPYSATVESIAAVRAEYRTVTGREISDQEAVWLQNWYRNTVGRRLYEAQSR